ncbi:MAG: endonuclease/exonuclease/phosphatase family protein [bacterium]
MLTKLFEAALIVCCLFIRCSNFTDPDAVNPASGEFALLTYNVAGLPQGISPSNPEKNTPLISPLLNNYDIVLVQEDFVFHEQLKSKAQHPYQSQPHSSSGQFDFGDGLNRFVNFMFTAFQRESWNVCSNQNGNDCLASKGFSVAETTLAPRVIVDIYNLHMDSGSGVLDIEARNKQIQQLLSAIQARSAGKAIILAGDTNLDTINRPEDEQLLQELLAGAGLTDSCRLLNCDQELVDRVLFRESDNLTLKPVFWNIDADFVDTEGNKLSDHLAVGVSFKWQVKPPLSGQK